MAASSLDEASCKIVVAKDSSELSLAAVRYVADISEAAIRDRGKFIVALSGGSMPKSLAPLAEVIPASSWAKWHVFFADERCVPVNHADSNFKACEAFLAQVPTDQCHPLPLKATQGKLDDASALARAYEAELRAALSNGSEEGKGEETRVVLDLCLLGMGPDGHTASLFPGHKLAAPDGSGAGAGVAVAAIEDSPKPPPVRITLTLPVLQASRAVAFIAGGGGKAPVLAKCFTANQATTGPVLVPNPASGFPCAAVVPTAGLGALTWFVDTAAAADLPARETAANVVPVEGRPLVGILGAMPSEIAKLKAHVTDQRHVVVSPFVTVTVGQLGASPVAFCAAGVGLVAAASACTVLIERFGAKAVVFTGVAGGLQDDLNVGDILVATDVVNYEFDCTAFVPPWDSDYRHKRGELPFTGGLRAFPSDPRLVALALSAKPREQTSVGPRMVTGRLASGSEFLTVKRKVALAPVWAELTEGSCGPRAVEMECAGVAQVCHQYGVSFLGLRAISDTLTGDANGDFNAFCQQAADSLWPVVEHVVTHV